MNTANRKRTEIDAELDRLEVEFEKNRKEMQRLADENRRAGNRYGELPKRETTPPRNLPRRG